MDSDDKAFDFLASVFPAHRPAAAAGRATVVLTYAQSLDGTIGERVDDSTEHRPLAISCADSLVLTHALRACCDGILVGVGTVIADDPKLSVRLVEREKAGRVVAGLPLTGVDNPRPVILDSMLRTPVRSRILERNPIIYCLNEASELLASSLITAGATVKKMEGTGHVSLENVVRSLWTDFGIRTLMVEGGSTIIRGFLSTPHLVDLLVVTIAPTIYDGGVRAYKDNHRTSQPPTALNHPKYIQFGRDIVMAGTIN
ncbi:hypothetical protein HDU67_000436 [Dinochytrium kinnereticum]|nr:hypothetical protein HDU67_000436 [Dinochytrium kinnereticum]